MNEEIMKTKRFQQHLNCADWYYKQVDEIMMNAYATDEELLASLDDLETKLLTLTAPFNAALNKIKTTMEQLKID
ncbi:TPA: hypothetical protein ACXE8V_001619 [Pluralibacter gergoviae]